MKCGLIGHEPASIKPSTDFCRLELCQIGFFIEIFFNECLCYIKYYLQFIVN